MRIPFLILTPASVFLAYATSTMATAHIQNVELLLVLICALLAHISVNLLNEYYDFRSGLDFKTSKTPFSGGSGALIENPEVATTVLVAGIASLVLTVVIGLYFTIKLGILVLPLGVIGVLIIITYTPWLNRYPFLCLVAPGIGFGPLMVLGSHVVFTGEYSVPSFYASLVPFFLVSNLLLLNQYPDIEADRSTGRRHFPIAYGVKKSTLLYGAFILAAFGSIIMAVVSGLLPKLSLLGLLPLVMAVVVLFGVFKHSAPEQKLIPYLGMNVMATVLTPVLLGFGIIYG